MDQAEILNLVLLLKAGTIGNADFKKLFRLIRGRSKWRGAMRDDIAMVTIEMIWSGETVPLQHQVNLYINQRIIDAKYRLGIATSNENKRKKDSRVQTTFVENVPDIVDTAKDYAAAEKDYEIYRVFFDKRTKTPRQYEAGGELF